jgi:hypothetical protein
MRLRSLPALIAVAAAGLLGTTSLPAAALPTQFANLVPSSIQDYYTNSDIPAGESRVQVSDCPAGSSAVAAGGMSSILESIAASNTAAAVHGAAGPGLPGVPQGFVYAVASCVPSQQLAGTTTVTRELHGGQQGIQGFSWGQNVNCPAGMRAFGGGGYFRTAGGAISNTGYAMSVNTINATGRGWYVRAKNSVQTDTLVVTTRCAYESSSTRIVSEVYPADTNGQFQGYAYCPAGYVPISGGAQIMTDNSPADTYSWLDASLPVRGGENGWWAKGGTDGTNRRLEVRVLCGI